MTRTQQTRGLASIALLCATGCFEAQFEDGPESGCEEAAAALSQEIYAAPQGCTAVVQTDSDFNVAGWTLVCGPENGEPLQESQARRLTECCESAGTAVNTPDPRDAFVFFDVDGDHDGTIAVVSRHTGRRVFEATLQGGEPMGVFPTDADFRPPTMLASDCKPDAVDDVASYDDDGDAPPVAVLQVLQAVETTGIVDAIRSGDGELLWSVVLRSGAGEPGTGGWVALLQSSSLAIDFTKQ